MKFYYSDGTTSEEIDWDKTLHREDGPAIERDDGTKYWYRDGDIHREDGPAAEFADGKKEWWLDSEEYGAREYRKVMKEVNEMSLVLRLTDPREWVRNFKV